MLGLEVVMLRCVLLMLVWSCAPGSAARAEPAVVSSGRVVLPLSGLVIDLPKDARKGFSWSLASSWRLAETDAGYDGRDVIDEKIDQTLVAGTWVQVGHFAAGDCRAVLRSVALEQAWESTSRLAGHDAMVRGGIHVFEGGTLGRRPAAVLCLGRAARKQLLVHRFLLDQPESMTREAVLAALNDSAALSAIADAWARDLTDVSTPPLRRSEVRRRGELEATRLVKLDRAGFSVRLPDDGLIWIVNRANADLGTDWLDLAAPAEPEVSIEIAVVTRASCAEFFAGLTLERRADSAPKNLPKGWEPGPTLVFEGEPELTTCKPIGADALVVGLFVAPFGEDVARYRPLLEAIATGAAAR